ncbi:mCG61360 [Mus musculus]|nr:mCG61360 [Mus musculus]
MAQRDALRTHFQKACTGHLSTDVAFGCKVQMFPGSPCVLLETCFQAGRGTQTLLTEGRPSPSHLPSNCLSYPLLLLRGTLQLPGGVHWNGLRTLDSWDAKTAESVLGTVHHHRGSSRRHQESGEQWLQLLEQEDDGWDEEKEANGRAKDARPSVLLELFIWWREANNGTDKRISAASTCAEGNPGRKGVEEAAGTTSFRALRWEQKGLGGGGASWWEPLPLPELSASSPARPAVWPWFLSRLLPVLPLTDIVSMGIYISLTTLSPNGIKSKASDK